MFNKGYDTISIWSKPKAVVGAIGPVHRDHRLRSESSSPGAVHMHHVGSFSRRPDLLRRS